MASLLITSVVVSGLGMLMLFVAMTVLYGLMYGMARLIKDGRQAEEQRTRRAEEQERGKARGRRRQAAVIAIALARAQQEMSLVGARRTEERISAWWTLHHHRQLTRNRRARNLS